MLPSLQDVPIGAVACAHVPSLAQLSIVHGFPSSHAMGVQLDVDSNPSWKISFAPGPKSMSRAMKAPVPISPDPKDSVPLGTSINAMI
jgi:hypothetical protein